MQLLVKYFFSTLVFLIAWSQSIKAQYAAEFTVNSEIACNPFTVVVTDLSGASGMEPINYDWGDGSPLDSAESHTYTAPGTYTIIQTVANANPRQDTVVVEVINQYPPEFYLFNCKGTLGSVIVRDTLYEAFEIDWGDGSTDIWSAFTLASHDYGIVSTFDITVKGLINGTQTPTDSSNLNCSSNTKRLNMINSMLPARINQVTVQNTDATAGSISVEYSLAADNNYLIEIMDQNQPAFSILDTINQLANPGNYIINNLNTTDNYYCISITAFDPCDGEMIQSNIGCSINLEATGGNQQNIINWESSSTDFTGYTLYKDGSMLANIISQGQNQYIDDQVNCGVSYEYVLHMTENGGFISISDTISVTATSSGQLDPIENISANVLEQEINLFWEEPQNSLALGYIISRSTDGILFDVLDTLTTPEYLDPGLLTRNTRYFYSILYYDVCGNMSAQSIIASPILLVNEFDLTLTWADYEGWQNGVSGYTLEKYDQNGQLIESIPLGLSTSYQEDQHANPYQYILYKIIAYPEDSGNGNVASNFCEIIYRSKVAFPNAFSPNGDGMNDIFNFESRYILSADMKIYNRWGELVFQTADADEGWDGNINGKPAPMGAYIYYTTLTDDMGITFEKSGEILLIR